MPLYAPGYGDANEGFGLLQTTVGHFSPAGRKMTDKRRKVPLL
jgi:hypothetical protein